MDLVMDKTHVLVKGKVDYADEFDLEFFGVFHKDEWKTICENKQNRFSDGPIEICFGTNEYVKIQDFDGWIENLSIKEITSVEFNMIAQNFGTDPFGTGSNYIKWVSKV